MVVVDGAVRATVGFLPQTLDIQLRLLVDREHADIVQVDRASSAAGAALPLRSRLVHVGGRTLRVLVWHACSTTATTHAHLEVAGFKDAFLNQFNDVDGVGTSHHIAKFELGSGLRETDQTVKAPARDRQRVVVV